MKASGASKEEQDRLIREHEKSTDQMVARLESDRLRMQGNLQVGSLLVLPFEDHVMLQRIPPCLAQNSRWLKQQIAQTHCPTILRTFLTIAVKDVSNSQ